MFRNSIVRRRVLRAVVVVASVGLSAAAPSAAAAAQPFGHRTLMPGMRGSDVQTLQRDLTSLGWRTNLTGVFNYWTTVHVKDFQQRSHLDADGVVGAQTYRDLRRAMAARGERNPASRGAKAPAQGRPAALPANDSGGAGFVPPNNQSNAPVQNATLNSDGVAVAPASAPAVIQNVIRAANKIAFDPYVYGGGHDGWGAQSGYDCSGSVSYALHGGKLLNGEPLDSTQFESYGEKGTGKWITIYSNSGHVWMTIAGLSFDTVNQNSSNGEDRWSSAPDSWETSQKYTVTHPSGW